MKKILTLTLAALMILAIIPFTASAAGEVITWSFDKAAYPLGTTPGQTALIKVNVAINPTATTSGGGCYVTFDPSVFTVTNPDATTAAATTLGDSTANLDLSVPGKVGGNFTGAINMSQPFMAFNIALVNPAAGVPSGAVIKIVDDGSVGVLDSGYNPFTNQTVSTGILAQADITPPAPTGITVSGMNGTTAITSGATIDKKTSPAITLSAAVAPAGAASGVTWSSSSDSIAAIASTGVVTPGTTGGTVTFTAASTADTTIKGTFTLTFVPYNVSGVTVSPAPVIKINDNVAKITTKLEGLSAIIANNGPSATTVPLTGISTITSPSVADLLHGIGVKDTDMTVADIQALTGLTINVPIAALGTVANLDFGTMTTFPITFTTQTFTNATADICPPVATNIPKNSLVPSASELPKSVLVHVYDVATPAGAYVSVNVTWDAAAVAALEAVNTNVVGFTKITGAFVKDNSVSYVANWGTLAPTFVVGVSPSAQTDVPANTGTIKINNNGLCGSIYDARNKGITIATNDSSGLPLGYSVAFVYYYNNPADKSFTKGLVAGCDIVTVGSGAPTATVYLPAEPPSTVDKTKPYSVSAIVIGTVTSVSPPYQLAKGNMYYMFQ